MKKNMISAKESAARHPAKGKTRITIYLDDDVLEAFRERADAAELVISRYQPGSSGIPHRLLSPLTGDSAAGVERGAPDCRVEGAGLRPLSPNRVHGIRRSTVVHPHPPGDVRVFSQDSSPSIDAGWLPL